jgi:hypothetical protein
MCLINHGQSILDGAHLDWNDTHKQGINNALSGFWSEVMQLTYGYQRTFEIILRIAYLGGHLRLSRSFMQMMVLYPRYQRKVEPSLLRISAIKQEGFRGT